MHIGIVTLPIHDNYGMILQNYALQKVLRSLGHTPITLNFLYPTPLWRVVLSTCKTLLLYFIPGRRCSFSSYRVKQSPQKKNTIRTMWRTCAKEAESTFSKMAFSKNDFFVIQKDADIMHNIAECWRLGGDDKRAQRLEMNAEQRLQESRMRSVDKKIEQEKDEKQKDENRR